MTQEDAVARIRRRFVAGLVALVGLFVWPADERGGWETDTVVFLWGTDVPPDEIRLYLGG